MNQSDLFVDGRQRRITRGRQYRDHGLEKVGRNNDEFMHRCRQYAIDCCRREGSVTIEQVRIFATCEAIIPTHPNAWGTIFKAKGFKPTGFAQNGMESAHARLVRVWTYVA
jgi:hypothetical protein